MFSNIDNKNYTIYITLTHNTDKFF